MDEKELAKRLDLIVLGINAAVDAVRRLTLVLVVYAVIDILLKILF